MFSVAVAVARGGPRNLFVIRPAIACRRQLFASTAPPAYPSLFRQPLGTSSQPPYRRRPPCLPPGASFSTSTPHTRFLPPRPPRRSGGYNYTPRDHDHERARGGHYTEEELRQLEERLRSARPLATPSSLWRLAKAPGTHAVVVLAIVAAVIFYVANLETVPVSGRRRFNCFSRHSMEELGEMQARRMEYELARHGGRFLSDWDPRTILVRRVMDRLIPFSGLTDSKWEVHVIDDPKTANAFVLPGGKVFVFSGILNVARNEHGLAAVLGHEIAHNVADHMAERLSQNIGMNILLGSLLLLSAAIPGGFLAVNFLGGSLLDVLFGLPMGRAQESEADYIGLMMMAEACYDPREAVNFWRRMDRAQQVQPPEWLSTHPSNQSRIEKLSGFLPQALERREMSDCRGTAAFAEKFRRALSQGIILSTDAAGEW